MVKYVLKRIGYIICVFFVVSILMFTIYKMVPGDPARMMLDGTMEAKDPARYEMMYQQARELLGLDKPIPVQYFNWITNMLKGDFGYSTFYRKPVIDIVAQPMKNTILLNVVSLMIVFSITIPLGIVTAVKKYSAFDNVVQVGSVIGYSVPTFIIALLGIFLFSVKLPLFPINGMNSPGFSGTGLAAVWDRLHHMMLPILVMTFGSLGGITRYVRTAMIEVLRMDYIRTARAKGLKEKVVIYSHAFRNALIPVVTIMTSWFIGVFGGSVVIETVFSWNGIGNVLFLGLKQQDFSVVLAMQMFYVVLALIGNLIMDLGYCLVDPRVKLD